MSPLSANSHSKLNRRDGYVLAGFLLFLLIFFFGVLAQPGERCLGRQEGDGRNQFYGWRAYGFGEVRAGRFPLWNPYEFLGMPFVASLQSAMFYPTNWLCAVLPMSQLGRAINLGIILNLFLSGLFTYLWARRFGLRWIGAIVAAATYVFGAPQILRIFEGHWSFLAPMPWIPCVLLCVEMLVCGGFRPSRDRARRGGRGDGVVRRKSAIRLLRRDRRRAVPGAVGCGSGPSSACAARRARSAASR